LNERFTKAKRGYSRLYQKPKLRTARKISIHQSLVFIFISVNIAGYRLLDK